MGVEMARPTFSKNSLRGHLVYCGADAGVDETWDSTTTHEPPSKHSGEVGEGMQRKEDKR
jgi:hypothetical protein